jgi:hypothetical protein
MTQSKHSPSPWHLGKNGDNCAKNHAICSGIIVIAKVYGAGYPASEGWSERSQADANVMVIAPELLAALKTVVETEYARNEESRNFDEERLQEFVALIAQAEGRAA